MSWLLHRSYTYNIVIITTLLTLQGTLYPNQIRITEFTFLKFNELAICKVKMHPKDAILVHVWHYIFMSYPEQSLCNYLNYNMKLKVATFTCTCTCSVICCYFSVIHFICLGGWSSDSYIHQWCKRIPCSAKAIVWKWMWWQ